MFWFSCPKVKYQMKDTVKYLVVFVYFLFLVPFDFAPAQLNVLQRISFSFILLVYSFVMLMGVYKVCTFTFRRFFCIFVT